MKYFLCMAAFSASIAIAGDNAQITCVKTLAFQSYLSGKIPGMKVTVDGAIGRNTRAFSDVATQRSALLFILAGTSTGDREFISKGVRALTYPFQFQKDDGTFQCPGAKNIPVGPRELYGEGMFIEAVGEAILLLQNSEYASEFVPRLLSHRDGVRKWLDHFMSVKDEVLKADTQYANRLAFNALALQSFGIIFNDSQLSTVAETFLRKVIEMQAPAGFYPDAGGPDTSYNAVTAWKMQVCSLYAPEPLHSKMQASIKKAMEWEISKINMESGEVNVAENVRTGKGQERFLGHLKDVNYEEVAYSLFFWETIGKNPAAGSLGLKVLKFAQKKYKR